MADDATVRDIIREWLERQGLLRGELAEAAAASLENDLRPWLRKTPYVPMLQRWAMDDGAFRVVPPKDRPETEAPPDR